MRLRNGLLMLLLAVLLVLPVTGGLAHEGGAHVRVAHLAADAPAVDVYVNGSLAVRNLAFKALSRYLPIEGYSLEVSLVPAGGSLDQAVLTQAIALPLLEGGYFTVAAVGLVSEGTLELIALPADSQSTGTAAQDHIVVRGAYARATAIRDEAEMPAGDDHAHDMHATEEAMGDHDMHATEEAMGDHDMHATEEAMGEHDMHATEEAMGGMGGMGHGGSGNVSAAFMVIENLSDTPDRLIAVSTSIAMDPQLHKTTVEDGVARMEQQMEGIEVPANGIVELKPGDFHVMLIDLTSELYAGDVIQVTLTFASGIELTLDVPVVSLF